MTLPFPTASATPVPAPVASSQQFVVLEWEDDNIGLEFIALTDEAEARNVVNAVEVGAGTPHLGRIRFAIPVAHFARAEARQPDDAAGEGESA